MYPYMNMNPQFMNQMQSPYMAQQRQEIIKVHGENGAKAYQIAPNSSVLLLDELEPIVWLKTTDGAGYGSVTAYKIEPYVAATNDGNINDLEKRIERLEKLYESNTERANADKTANE